MSPDYAGFVRANTQIAAPPLLPEIALHLATEITPLWHATEATLAASQLPPPYWAFAWPGGQALGRHLLDRPELVRGRAVLDLGAGSGLLAIAAMKAGARCATAAETDAFAAAAIGLNAALNAVAIAIEGADVIGGDGSAWETVLVGDMCYERPLAERILAWLTPLAQAGVSVLLGDPGRAYLPKEGLVPLGHYPVPTPLDLEDRAERMTTVWRLAR